MILTKEALYFSEWLVVQEVQEVERTMDAKEKRSLESKNEMQENKMKCSKMKQNVCQIIHTSFIPTIHS